MTYTITARLADHGRRTIILDAIDAETAVEAASLLIAEDTCVPVIEIELS